MSDYKEKAEPLLQNLKNIKTNCLLTDCYKETVNHNFKLFMFSNDSLSIKIENEDEYNKITDYIVKELNFPNFVFHKDTYDGTKKYLVWQGN